MSFLNALKADLVEKRLWPIAALLAAAAIGVPVVSTVTATKSSAPPALVQGATSPVGLSTSLRALVAQTAPDAGVPYGTPGHLHDPFVSPAPAATAAAAPSKPGVAPGGPSTASTTTSTTSTTSSGSTGTTTTTTSSTPASTTPSSTSSKSTPATTRSGTIYTIAMRFGQAASLRSFHDPIRLTTLPSTANPQVVFLGVVKGGKSAAFLLSSKVTPTGDGTCEPVPAGCQVLRIKPGGTEFLDVAGATGLVQYELDLVRIGVQHTTKKAVATRAVHRVSTAGKTAVRTLGTNVLSGYVFSTQLGVLVLPSSGPVAGILGLIREASATMGSANATPGASTAPATPTDGTTAAGTAPPGTTAPATTAPAAAPAAATP
jgi:hypothetical protein